MVPLNPRLPSTDLKRLLDELGVEYAFDDDAPRFVMPTESGPGIVAELVELPVGECVVLILPLLQGLPSPVPPEAMRLALVEQAHMLFGKVVYDEDAGVLELRHELLLPGLDAARLGVSLSALSQHAALGEQLEGAFGGESGPSYADLLEGA